MMKACEICKVEVAHFLVADVKKGDIVEVCKKCAEKVTVMPFKMAA